MRENDENMPVEEVPAEDQRAREREARKDANKVTPAKGVPQDEAEKARAAREERIADEHGRRENEEGVTVGDGGPKAPDARVINARVADSIPGGVSPGDVDRNAELDPGRRTGADVMREHRRRTADDDRYGTAPADFGEDEDEDGLAPVDDPNDTSLDSSL